jgi:hypothetical protein
MGFYSYSVDCRLPQSNAKLTSFEMEMLAA